jgi:hypothetical protein
MGGQFPDSCAHDVRTFWLKAPINGRHPQNRVNVGMMISLDKFAGALIVEGNDKGLSYESLLSWPSIIHSRIEQLRYIVERVAPAVALVMICFV